MKITLLKKTYEVRLLYFLNRFLDGFFFGAGMLAILMLFILYLKLTGGSL